MTDVWTRPRWLLPVLALGVAMIDAPWPRLPELGSLLVLVVLATRPRLRQMASPVLVGLLLLWLGMSLLWSVSPGGTVKATIRTVLIVLAAALLVRTQRPRELAAAVGVGTSLLCLLALVWLAVYPGVATSPDGLKGMMPQNNSMAYVAAIAVISMVFALDVPVLPRLALLGLDLVVLGLTLSMTSWLATVAAIASPMMLLLLHRLTGRARAAMGVLSGGVLITVGYLLWFIPFTEMVGRDATLTGRTDIWPEMLRIANQRWLTGWGHGAPWLPGSWIRDWAIFHFDFHMVSAHNALLETYLQLGLVGVVLVVLLWTVGLARTVSGVWRTGHGTWLLAIVFFQLVHGLAEATQGAPLGWLVTAIIWLAPPTQTVAAEQPPVARRALP